MRPARAGLLLLALLAPLLAQAAPQPAEAVIVQLAAPPSPEQRLLLATHGVPRVLDVMPAGLGLVTEAQRAWLAAQPWVLRIDAEQPLVRHLDRTTRLVRAGQPVLDLGVDGRGVTVAVLDSGIDPTHPDVQGRVRANVVFVNGAWQPTQVDTDGHGTHVAGIVAGSGAASGGALRGVAPGAGLVGMDFGRAFTTGTALEAFDWVLRNRALYDIRVVQNSWGRAEVPIPWDPGDPLVRASDRLVQEGLVLVYSAGNHGPGAGSISLEGQNPNVITVGAVDDAALLAGFSGRGPVVDDLGQPLGWVKPDVVAGGVAVRSARSAQAAGPTGQPVLEPSQLPGLGQPAGPGAVRYTDLTGTSQAAPHVAGLAALMLSAQPSLTPAQVHDLLRATAIDLGAPGPDDATGFGLVDARDAVRAALGLAEDRGNILLAGGEERYEARGRLAGAAGQLVQTAPVVQVKATGAVEADFPVKPGATAVRFDFAWEPASAAFRVYLVGPTQTLGPWTASAPAGARRVLSGAVDQPEPGVHRLVARPVGTADAAYDATMAVTIGPEAQAPAELDPRFRAPGRGGPLDVVGQEWEREVDQVASDVRRLVPAPPWPLAALALAAAGLLVRRLRA